MKLSTCNKAQICYQRHLALSGDVSWSFFFFCPSTVRYCLINLSVYRLFMLQAQRSFIDLVSRQRTPQERVHTVLWGRIKQLHLCLRRLSLPPLSPALQILSVFLGRYLSLIIHCCCSRPVSWSPKTAQHRHCMHLMSPREIN